MTDVEIDLKPPWERLFPKQLEVFNARNRILLVSGSRLSGKTIACINRIVRHLWETPMASVGFYAKSIKLAKDSGPWQQLVEQVVPDWINAGIGMEYTTRDGTGQPGPKQDAQTRTTFFRVRNYHGGESECRLFSIDHDQEVAQKVRSKVFSMMYFSELSMFKDPRILSTTLPSLRMPHLLPPTNDPDAPDNWHMWLGDTNPDEEEGNRSWFYKMFWIDRLNPNHPWLKPSVQRSMRVIEMFLTDNPHVRQQQVDELIGTCGGDPALYDSYVLGKHGDAGKLTRRWFSAHFSRQVHVVGGTEEEGDQIDVQPSTTVLQTGWDLGGSTNHGAGILEKWERLVDTVQDGQIIQVPKTAWSVLDELVFLNEQVSLDEFAVKFLEKMIAIEKRSGKRFEWEHWSDDTAVNVWRASSASYDYLEIQSAILRESKGMWDVVLRPVLKPDGSVMARCRLLQRKLRDGLLFVSSRCTHVIEMLEEARKDENGDFFSDKHKHTFDWLTYPMYMAEIDELTSPNRPTASKPDDNIASFR